MVNQLIYSKFNKESKMRLSLKYEQKLEKDKFLAVLDIGVISTEICRLKNLLRSIGVSAEDKSLEKLRLWKD